MDSDEDIICAFLKLYPREFVSGTEICRRAGTRKRYRKEPAWALPILKRMVDKRILESDATGHYRLISPREKGPKRRLWVSPKIRRILEQSGKTFEIVPPEEDSGSVNQHYK